MGLNLLHWTRFGDARRADLIKRLQEQERELRQIDANRRAQYDHVASVVIGGDLLVNYMYGGESVPSDVERAYQLAYPREAETRTFVEHAKSLEDDQLLGLVSGVKGKLFELQYLDQLNGGLLEPGYTAELAESPTQPGWDIQVLSPDGTVAGELQLKATQSIGYARRAFEEYPEVDVVVPQEMATHLEVIALTDALHNDNSGDLIYAPISEEQLRMLVEKEASDKHGDIEIIDSVPMMTLALCALQGLRAPEGMRLETTGEKVVPRLLLYQAALSASPILTPIGGVLLVIGTNYAIGQGKRKRDDIRHLEQLLETHGGILNRRKELQPPRFYRIRRWWTSLKRRLGFA